MAAIELKSFEMRLGKFEGVQQQPDQRLADIEHRLGTLEKPISDLRTEGHQDREALRLELLNNLQAVTSESALALR